MTERLNSNVACEVDVLCLKAKSGLHDLPIWMKSQLHYLLASCVPSGELLNLPKLDILRDINLVHILLSCIKIEYTVDGNVNWCSHYGEHMKIL